jgi:hypothetical protein
MLGLTKSFLRPLDRAVLAAVAAHALAQIGGSILIWRGALSIPEAVTRAVVAIEPTQHRLAAAFQVYAFNFSLWTVFFCLMAWLVLASPQRRAAALTRDWTESAALLALLAIMLAPAISLYFNLFPTTYARRGNNILTSDSLHYVFKYAGELSISAALWALVWAIARIRAVEAASMARWARANTAYDDVRRADSGDR